jgi:GntR family transcriptional regulator/MocR family aminotransferase
VNAKVGAGTFVSPHVAPASPERSSRREGILQPQAVWNRVRLTAAAFDQPAEYDFRTGLPDASLFPLERWRRSMTRAMRSESVAGGSYGHPAGHRALREAIARHIAVARGVQTSADDVTVTTGTQQALDVVARVLLAPGDRVAVEDPGYSPPRLLFETLGVRVIGVPVDREGLVVDALPRDARLVYVTPSHQYPLGMSMTLSRRLALLAWAERHDAAIVEDDYDSEFRFGGRPIEPIQTLDKAGRVIYVGTFSKTLLPALRLGFIMTPRSLRDAVHKAKYVTDWHTSMVAQAALANFIEDGSFARHVRRALNVYRERHSLVVRTLANDLQPYLEVIPSNAGLHVTAVARELTVAHMLRAVNRASELGVGVLPLSRFAFDVAPRSGVVIGYGAIPTAKVKAGLRLLKRSFDRTGG